MSAMDDLKARARSSPDTSSWQDLQLTRGGARQPELLIDEIIAHFGAHETSEEVRVIVDDDVIGYISRVDTYDLVDFMPKGIGRPPRGTMYEIEEEEREEEGLEADFLPGDPTARDDKP